MSKKYPKSIYLIMAVEFCERFSFCGLRTMLSLYLRDVLHFSEKNATILYHLFYALCYVVPIIGAILADSVYGRYRTIRFFSSIYVLGNLFLCFGAIPSLELPLVKTTLLGLVLVGFGTGGIKPCVAALCGEQFHIPEQRGFLEQFFSLFFFTINVGGFLGMILIPLIRKATPCYDGDTCYALGFAVPALLMLLALVLFLLGKPMYCMKVPKSNIILQFLKCSLYALKKKLKSNSHSKKCHWLDYAEGMYPDKLICDMKTVLAILFLFIPLPLFWSLFDQQGSSWTFQAARTDRTILGIHILPDQMQVLNPLLSLAFIPLFEKCIYPGLDKYRILENPLRRMVWGGMIAGFAFLCAGYLELDLQGHYYPFKSIRNPRIIIVNTLPCSLSIVNDINYLDEIVSRDILFYDNVTTGVYLFNAIAPRDCDDMVFQEEDCLMNFTVVASPEKDSLFVISSNHSKMSAYSFEDTFISKGYIRKLAVLKIKALNFNPKYSYLLKLTGYNSEHSFQVAKEDFVKTFEDVSIVAGTYEVEILINPSKFEFSNSKNISIKQENFEIEHGGIYSYIVCFKVNNELSENGKSEKSSAALSDAVDFVNLKSKKNKVETYLTDFEDSLDIDNSNGNHELAISVGDSTTVTENIMAINGGNFSILENNITEKKYQIFSKFLVLSPGKTVKMIYLLPQYILISVAEVMFAVAGLHFSFTQAPKSMKTVTIATWHFSVAIGNLIIIFIEQMKPSDQATEFFLYATLIFADMLLFFKMTNKYKFVKMQTDESSSLLITSSGNDEIFFNLNNN